MKLLAPVVLACALLLSGVAAATPDAATCSVTELPVTGPTGPATVSGQLCLPAGPAPNLVQFLVHGGTYNRAYWDIPGASYQRDMADHGQATFAVDRLGTGASTHPLSIPLLINVESASMHEVIGHLRAGHVGGVQFNRVVIVGHSVGSGIVAAEAATYHDVDGVVLSGMTHMPSVPALVLGAALGLQPAFIDPTLASLGTDPLYFTTKPGARAPLFYNTSDADPSVIAADEATKDEVSVPGMGTVAVFGIVLPTTLGINVPVFQAVGSKDVLFCGLLALRDCSSAASLRAQEAPYYSAAADLTTYVLPGAGHSLALHRNASDYRDATRAWLTGHFGA
ncbi:alpha/beta hydrolase [Actinocrispum wychmicini]|uniref:Alpha-beta hydrolase superfamily lysophospholipase n=1 Tax=Actinocrispum wychmicini TaxID=1213861 RepID=A0A4R2JRC5_9PSEU|nr:alpha/beta fold hydrolase [Actinocrispum wychmicini]TCO59768.1 alpha-beta hydrolase superfamily lysophospholipase [Actinocrispum wychmicini]